MRRVRATRAEEHSGEIGVFFCSWNDLLTDAMNIQRNHPRLILFTTDALTHVFTHLTPSSTPNDTLTNTPYDTP